MRKFFTKFINSEITTNSPSGGIPEIKKFVNDVRLSVKTTINPTKFSKLDKWSFSQGAIIHSSGGFFKIRGLRQRNNHNFWDQPIIDQPEIGFLGIIVKEFNDTFYFLLQAKLEPGNINGVQLSPTLQATKSNFTCLHNGTPPKYLDNFLNVKKENIIFDQLQSEQGARFLNKKNRNILIHDQNVEIDSKRFIWLSLGQIRSLIKEDNFINMDTRTILSQISYADVDLSDLNDFLMKKKIPYNDFFISEISKFSSNSLSFIHSTISEIKFSSNFRREIIPLEDLSDWIIDDDSIYREDKNFFSIVPLEISISNREVVKWSQPIFKPSTSGLCVFIVKKINNVLHFLCHIKFECGNLDFFEIGPTVQCLESNLNKLDFNLLEIITNLQDSSMYKIHHDSMQSEEGGRFLNETNRNIIVELVTNDFLFQNDQYIWVTLNQIKELIQYSNVVNIQARNLVSLVNFFE